MSCSQTTLTYIGFPCVHLTVFGCFFALELNEWVRKKSIDEECGFEAEILALSSSPHLIFCSPIFALLRYMVYLFSRGKPRGNLYESIASRLFKSSDFPKASETSNETRFSPPLRSSDPKRLCAPDATRPRVLRLADNTTRTRRVFLGGTASQAKEKERQRGR